MPRIFSAQPLAAHTRQELDPGAARHVQVLRLQPGDALTLFDGRGGEYAATVQRMGRSDVAADIGAHDPVEREAMRQVHLAVGLIASDRMDWLIEKATELGAASIQPLAAERSVLRLTGERADKKQAHWTNVAVAACEQCGRNRVPLLHPVRSLTAWLAWLPGAADPAGLPGLRLALSFSPLALVLAGPSDAVDASDITLLSGPEGGLSPLEEALALQHGFAPASLGRRILRAETAPLAALARLA